MRSRVSLPHAAPAFCCPPPPGSVASPYPLLALASQAPKVKAAQQSLGSLAVGPEGPCGESLGTLVPGHSTAVSCALKGPLWRHGARPLWSIIRGLCGAGPLTGRCHQLPPVQINPTAPGCQKASWPIG
ncbi:hypothetical protein EYF80_020111 [Liparis tanakae]|uniref:Uncharacterized protein n=1 Tax=Liparis tanakae TaxID=230148 RepID=A0A4Z2HVK8_9TELE|nr:hypothetical protein EYF80_020111 [Liparis tanakae]